MEEDKKVFKSGMVSIVGRPNVGKSTLLNEIVGEKVSIVSNVPQTTRNRIRGIYMSDLGQIVFIDTPGLHLAADGLDKYMNRASDSTFNEVDCIIYLVDLSRRIGEEENLIAEKLSKVKTPIIMAMNKVDANAKRIPEYIEFWEKIKGKPVNEMENFSMIPISADKRTNIDELIGMVFENLEEGPLLYPADIVCDVPHKMAIADIIREKFLQTLKQEVPHSLGVVIEHMQPKRKKTTHIKAIIFVERPTQKEIVIGKNGSLLKEVGTRARVELEGLLDTKVFLEMHVCVEKDWRLKATFMQDMGYADGGV